MRAALTLFLFISLIMSSGCSDSGDSEISISDGVWLGEAGPDTFAFDFSEDSTGNITGVIHCLSEGRKYSEIPMSTVEWNPPELEIFLGATEVTYRGVMEDSVIHGNIIA
ncbi:MAG: hypothetical protein KAQ97_00350, partial [Candidatus Fermentibacteraceae bacterium]|nr:hypothetical protein [Candidatus Fermentibacteraceae bacterium]